MTRRTSQPTALVRTGTRLPATTDAVIAGEIIEEPYERAYLERASPCETDMFPGGPRTVRDAVRLGSQPCPNLRKCNAGYLDNRHCTMRWGSVIAREALKSGSLEAEMADFRAEHPRMSGGWVTSDDRVTIRVVADDDDGERRVEAFAARLLDGLLHRRPAPDRDRVGSSFEDVVAASTTREGYIDLARMGQFEGRFGSNGGRGCDVQRGPCSCGAWH